MDTYLYGHTWRRGLRLGTRGSDWGQEREREMCMLNVGLVLGWLGIRYIRFFQFVVFAVSTYINSRFFSLACYVIYIMFCSAMGWDGMGCCGWLGG